MVRFALITLVHNKERFLKKCLNSALSQTYKDFLYFIVDDGSLDGSRAIIKNYKKLNRNIIFFPFNDKAGQMPRYNFVLNKINESYPNIEYMGHLDGDDMLIPVAIEKSVKFFDEVKRNNVGHVSSLFSIIDGNDKVIHKYGRSFPRMRTQAEWRKAQVSNNLLGHFRVMRIECLNKVGGFDERFKYATDFNMACRMLDKYNVDLLPQILYLWRSHTNQVEKVSSKKQTECWKQMQLYYKRRWSI